MPQPATAFINFYGRLAEHFPFMSPFSQTQINKFISMAGRGEARWGDARRGGGAAAAQRGVAAEYSIGERWSINRNNVRVNGVYSADPKGREILASR